MNIVDRFIKYVKIDSQSDPKSDTVPTTKKQLDMAKVLVEDMLAMGISDAHVNEFGIVYGSIQSNAEAEVEAVGFIAHMDTAPDMSGTNVNPQIIKHYDGSVIVLNKELGIEMDPKKYDSLNGVIGKDLIVTDGTTLLGADDKAGVAEILEMCQYFLTHPEEKHGPIKIAFTPDEEVGKGADNFDVDYFGAAYAYTVDGGDIRSLDYENFNAAGVEVEIQGSSIHPGDAKDKMLNASTLALEFHSYLPTDVTPEKTSGYEGFNHLLEISGRCEYARMEYIIRNHDEGKFLSQKAQFETIRDTMNQKYGDVIQLNMSDTYYNMEKPIRERMEIIDDVKKIMKRMGLNPISSPIRGGTDGSKLTFMGLLCPNIGTGGANFHGKYEYVCIQSMEIISNLLVEIAKDKVK